MCVYTEDLWKLTSASGRVSIYWGFVNIYLPLTERVYTEGLWTSPCLWQSEYILRVCEHLPASGRASIYWGFVNIYQTLAEQVYTEGLWTPIPASGRASIYWGLWTLTCIWQNEYILRFVNTYLPLAEWVYTEGLWQISAGYFGFHQHFYHIPIFLSHTNSTLKKETHAVLVTMYTNKWMFTPRMKGT